MRRSQVLSLLVSSALLALPAGCGGGGQGAAPPSPPTERADARPKLPAAWKRLVNQEAGFSLGLPPGWTGRGARGTTLIRSADRAVAIAITADRSDDGLTAPLAQYARHTLLALPGYSALHVGAVRRRTGTQYPAVTVQATGRYTATKVRQAIQLIALRRDHAVTFTLAIFRNASAPEKTYAPALGIMLRTFRGQPAAF
jgi:hypothetical protein